MKNLITIAIVVLLSAGHSFGQKANEKVQVNQNGSWYDATILKVNKAEGTYFISYDGWSDSWDEWVTIDRLKDYSKEAEPEPKAALTKFKVGDKVEVEYGMIPEPATIIEIGENKYHIEFDNRLFGDKWVTENKITKL